MKWIFTMLLAFVVFSCTNGNHTPVPTATPTQKVLVIPTQVLSTPVPTGTPVVITATPSPTPTIISSYVVREGDTLIEIAQKFGISLGYLADANGIENPDLIYIGQILKIPVWPPKDDGRIIYVVLSEQKTYAVENGQVIKEFIVSTGTAAHPTVTGHYKIYVKYRYDDMDGPGYHLPDVPYVMYFYKGYGLHGTYWHHNFGVPMSHGCVNLTIPDAEWLFNWAHVGTPVVVIE